MTTRIEALTKKSADELTGKELMQIRRFKSLKSKLASYDEKAKRVIDDIAEKEKERQRIATKQAELRQKMRELDEGKVVVEEAVDEKTTEPAKSDTKESKPAAKSAAKKDDKK